MNKKLEFGIWFLIVFAFALMTGMYTNRRPPTISRILAPLTTPVRLPKAHDVLPPMPPEMFRDKDEVWRNILSGVKERAVEFGDSLLLETDPLVRVSLFTSYIIQELKARKQFRLPVDLPPI